MHTLCSIFREKDHKVESVDLTGNDLSAEHIQFIKMSLAANKFLTSIDLRRNPGYDEGNDNKYVSFYVVVSNKFHDTADPVMKEIERIIQANEILAKKY